MTLNARLRNGLMLQIGTTTGREVEDHCDTDRRDRSRHWRRRRTRGTAATVDPWLTTLRGLASYTIPKIDVLVSGTFRSQPARGDRVQRPGPGDVERAEHGCAVAARPSASGRADHRHHGGAASSTRSTACSAADRRNQVDMRVAKILRFGRTRADIGFDLQNLFNTNYATQYSVTYAYDSPGDDR